MVAFPHMTSDNDALAIWLGFHNHHHVHRTTYILPTKTYLSSFPKPTTSLSAGTVFWTAGSKRSFHESIHNSNPYQLQTPLISQGNTSFLLSVIDSTAKLELLAVHDRWGGCTMVAFTHNFGWWWMVCWQIWLSLNRRHSIPNNVHFVHETMSFWSSKATISSSARGDDKPKPLSDLESSLLMRAFTIRLQTNFKPPYFHWTFSLP